MIAARTAPRRPTLAPHRALPHRPDRNLRIRRATGRTAEPRVLGGHFLHFQPGFMPAVAPQIDFKPVAHVGTLAEQKGASYG